MIYLLEYEGDMQNGYGTYKHANGNVYKGEHKMAKDMDKALTFMQMEINM